jgi:hypothetical protein
VASKEINHSIHQLNRLAAAVVWQEEGVPLPFDSSHSISPCHPLARTALQYARPLGALWSSDAVHTSSLSPARLGAPGAIGLILGSSRAFFMPGNTNMKEFLVNSGVFTTRRLRVYIHRFYNRVVTDILVRIQLG